MNGNGAICESKIHNDMITKYGVRVLEKTFRKELKKAFPSSNGIYPQTEDAMIDYAEEIKEEHKNLSWVAIGTMLAIVYIKMGRF